MVPSKTIVTNTVAIVHTYIPEVVEVDVVVHPQQLPISNSTSQPPVWTASQKPGMVSRTGQLGSES